jgi:hypothetical protein
VVVVLGAAELVSASDDWAEADEVPVAAVELAEVPESDETDSVSAVADAASVRVTVRAAEAATAAAIVPAVTARTSRRIRRCCSLAFIAPVSRFAWTLSFDDETVRLLCCQRGFAANRLQNGRTEREVRHPAQYRQAAAPAGRPDVPPWHTGPQQRAAR